jgi:protein-L-isoaspartate(D-aspartate) O-methyltransferase
MTQDPNLARLMAKLRAENAAGEAVLAAMEAVPRKAFVPEYFADRAHADEAVPLAAGQTISQPTVVATMTQALDIRPADKVLEIGTGSGYQAAILAKLAQRVFTVERHATLSRAARATLGSLGIANVEYRIADGMLGWPEAAPFDRIMVTAAATLAPPPALLAQLSPEAGVMVLPVAESPGDEWLWRVTRHGPKIERVKLDPVRFVPLLSGVPKR